MHNDKISSFGCWQKATRLWSSPGEYFETNTRPGTLASGIQESSQRMAFAAEQMMEAANELQGMKKTTEKGKGWLKQ